MPVIRHIDALLGTTWAWDEDEDDDLCPRRTDVEPDSGSDERLQPAHG